MSIHRLQVPITPAWAVTDYKVQGSTFEAITLEGMGVGVDVHVDKDVDKDVDMRILFLVNSPKSFYDPIITSIGRRESFLLAAEAIQTRQILDAEEKTVSSIFPFLSTPLLSSFLLSSLLSFLAF
jgi:hypothetical protein